MLSTETKQALNNCFSSFVNSDNVFGATSNKGINGRSDCLVFLRIRVPKFKHIRPFTVTMIESEIGSSSPGLGSTPCSNHTLKTRFREVLSLQH